MSLLHVNRTISIIEESVQIKYKSIKISFKVMKFKEKKSFTNIPQAEGMNTVATPPPSTHPLLREHLDLNSFKFNEQNCKLTETPWLQKRH